MDRIRLIASGLDSRPAILVAISVLTLVYVLTARWDVSDQTRDSLGAALPAWSLVERGTLDLAPFKDHGVWIVATDNGYYSNRTPGLIAFTALGYLVASPWVSSFNSWPATLVAVVTTAGAVMSLAFLGEVRERPSASLLAIVLVGLGTSLWGVAADQIWPHGPAVLAVALALLFISKNKLWLAGVALGLGILVRSPVVVIAAMVGLGLSLSRKSIWPAFAIGVPTSVAATALLIYNSLLFGSISPTAAYQQFGGMTGSSSWSSWLGNTLVALFSHRYGVLVWSFWLVMAISLIPYAWKRSPDWMRWTPIAALAYVLTHTYLNRASGGLPFGYRYPLEAIVLITPLAMTGLKAIEERRVYATLLVLSGAASVFLQSAYTILSRCKAIGTLAPMCDLLGRF